MYEDCRLWFFTDINECVLNENLCTDGRCLNTDGSFMCICPENSVLSPDGKRCVDIRQDLCYDNYTVIGKYDEEM